MANAKKSLSSCQLARDLNLNQKSAWYMMQRIKTEMGRKEDPLLSWASSQKLLIALLKAGARCAPYKEWWAVPTLQMY